MFADGFGKSDGTADFSRVDTTHSTGVILDARQLVCQSRSNGSSYLTEYCTSLNGWTVHTGGSASVSVATVGEAGTANPSGTSSFMLNTGSTEGNYCALNRSLTVLPASYGVFLVLALPEVSTYPNDALQLTIQNTVDERILNLLFYAGQISVGDDSDAFHSLSTHCPPYGCENWIENKDNGDGTNTVTLWQGTQLIASQTIIMPTQSYPGMVYLQQQSGVTPNQKSQILSLNIGSTQLPDNGLLQGVPINAPYNASVVNFEFKVEDVCNAVVMGTDFTAAVIHNGAETTLTLTDDGTDGLGTIDYTKPVRLFRAARAAPIAQGDTLAYKCHMLNGKFMAVKEVSFDLTAIY